MMLRLAATGLILLTLAGCGALNALGDAARPLDVYELRAPRDLPVATAPIRREVIVEIPSATGTLDTERVMIRPGGLQAQYLADAQWGEPAPVMLQTLMLRSLTATDGILYVARRPLGGGGDFAVVTDLVDFQAEDRGAAGIVVRIAMNSRIVRESNVSILASRSFAAEAPAASADPADVVAAFDTAVSAVLTDFTLWTLASLGRPL